MLGDNLAPVSDTTICSALSQGVDVPGVVRSRLKYAAAASVLTVAALLVLGSLLNGPAQAGTGSQGFDAVAFLMLVPVLLTVAVAVKTGDIVAATTVGIVLAAAVGALSGQFAVFSTALGANALVTLTGEGLDRAVGGILYNGLSGMVQVCVLALLLFGSTAVMRAGGGDERLLQALGKVARTPRSTEFVISAMVVALSCIMGLNAPAILAVGASFAKPLAQAQGISPYRTANLLDAMSNTLVYALPWTPGRRLYHGIRRRDVGTAVGTPDHPLRRLRLCPARRDGRLHPAGHRSPRWREDRGGGGKSVYVGRKGAPNLQITDRGHVYCSRQ